MTSMPGTANEILRLLGGVLALGMYAPFIHRVLKDGGAGQSFAMWALWGVLDTLITISLLMQRGNYLLTAGFAVGSIALATILLFQGRFGWGRLETTIVLLVLSCLGVWKFSGPRAATVATTLAILIAGVPGMAELWRRPVPAVGKLWGGFALANLMALIGGAAWTVEERLAPAAFTIQTLVMLAVGHRLVIRAAWVQRT